MASGVKDLDGRVGVRDMVRFDATKIRVEKNFNPRVKETLRANIDRLKPQIAAAGGVLQPLWVRRDGDECVLIDGESRLTAVLELIKEGSLPAIEASGKPFGVPVLVMEGAADEATRIQYAMTANGGAPLEKWEIGRNYAKLINLGQTEAGGVQVKETTDMQTVSPLQPGVTPMDLMQLAIAKEGSIDVIERLALLQMQFTDREDKIAFRNAMTLFKEDMPTVIRNRAIKDKDGNDKYKAVALEDVADPVMKSLVKLGITYRYKTADLPDGRIRVTCILGLRGTAYEEEGSSLAAPPDTSGGKDALKAVGSTTSYLEKYTLIASVGMHVYNTDPEAVEEVGMSNGDAIGWIEHIRKAETPEAVMGGWKQAIEVAKSLTPIDYKAMTILTEARDERLKELKKSK